MFSQNCNFFGLFCRLDGHAFDGLLEQLSQFINFLTALFDFRLFSGFSLEK